MTATLHSVATAVPPHGLEQGEVIDHARRLFAGRYRDFERLSPIFTNAGIQARQFVRPVEWYLQEQSWPSRTAAYLEGAEALFIDAAGKALAAAGLTAQAVDMVVTVSSTGIATPSLEARVAGRMGFRSDVSRVPVFGLGCAGGVSGLSIAARLAEARPGAVVLMVAVELCSLSVRLDQLTPQNMVATALFGDGAAACVLTAGEGPVTIRGAAEHTWPDTLGIMGWNVDPQGFGVIFDRSIPPFAAAEFAPAMDRLLAGMGLERGEVDRFVCHPGGAKVVQALEAALGLEDGSLDIERQVLADHGNMSAPTVLFVLERALRRGLTGRLVATALGPGFTASAVSMKAKP